METIKMGKRGTIVLPAKLRKQFGLEDGSLLNVDVDKGRISLKPVFVYEPQVWSDEERCYFILTNASTKEEWDAYLPDVLELGIDPAKIEGLPLNYRDTLPTEAEVEERRASRREKQIA